MLALILAVASLRAEDKPKPIPAPIKEQAMPLRRLAKPLPDRGPFVDPTREIAMAVLLKAPMPARKRPIPFAPIDLPDPYDRRETVQFSKILAEDSTPVTRFMRVPKR
jgi:hypothetical protein